MIANPFYGRDEATMIRQPVGAVIVPCTNRKRHAAGENLRAVSLPFSGQADVETAWIARVRALRGTVPAGDLYTGRGAHLGRRAAASAGSRLYFASAGLGLIESRTLVPAYALTVAGRGVDAVASRIEGRFDPSAWWSAVSRAPGSSSIADVARASAGCYLVALTHPYAMLLLADLEALPEDDKGRLRLFGWKLGEFLPAIAAAGCDALRRPSRGGRSRDAERLPATRARALPEQRCDARGDGQAAHREAVRAKMAELVAPRRKVRPKATDGEILQWIGDRLPVLRGVQRLLRGIREEGIACEQARFSRLYRQAMEGSAA